MKENTPIDAATYMTALILIIVIYILIAKFIVLDLLIPMYHDPGVFVFGAMTGIFFKNLKVYANWPIKKD